MAQKTGFEPLVSVVNYDITSSNMDFSEIHQQTARHLCTLLASFQHHDYQRNSQLSHYKAKA